MSKNLEINKGRFMSKVLRIFALGGNEIAPTGEIDPVTKKMINPDVAMQWQRSAKTCELIAGIIKDNPDNYYILTHGNGPQVGNILLRAELAQKNLHSLPLDVCGADSQGAIGYMLAQLTNYMHVLGLKKEAAELVTQVVVDSKDPAFLNPTKYIGSALSKEEAQEKEKNEGWKIKMYKKNDNGTEVWRRVVPSPIPVDIVELPMIEAHMKMGMVPIAVGGGGIPVVKVAPKREGDFEVYQGRFGVPFKRAYKEGQAPADIFMGVEAVIDKDLASALLGVMLQKRAQERGESLSAEFTIFTDADGAKINFQKPDQKDLRLLTVKEAEALYNEGHFPDGSMGPKMLAAINFVKNGGKKAYITKVSLFNETLAGKAGTTIIP